MAEEYDLIAEQNEAKSYERSFILWPRSWRRYLEKPQHNFRWEQQPFCSSSLNKIPDVRGLYTFIVNPNIANHRCSYLMYLGITTRQTLRKRFQQYLQEMKASKSRPRVNRLLNLYNENYLFFCFARYNNQRELEAIEDNLLEAFIPPCNSDLPARVRRVIKGIR